MRKRNFLIAFAAVMISLLMLCGCSENDIGEIEGTYVGTDISRYIDIEEEPTETLSETVPEDDTETSDGKISDEEISDSETANDTIISEEITSADIPGSRPVRNGKSRAEILFPQREAFRQPL